MKEGDSIVMRAAKGRIELRSSERTPAMEELVALITPDNSYGETDWGPDRGKEIVER